jgi:uncharacterized membrane protein YfcA
VLIASVTKLFGSGAYVARREVSWPLVWKLALGSVPGALFGDQLLRLIPKTSIDLFVTYGLGFVLVLAGTLTLYRTWSRTPTPTGPMPSTILLASLGLLTGFLVTVTSVGSGSLLMVALVRFVPLPARKLVGSDIVHALILSSVATVLHAHSGRLDVHLALSVLVGSIPGVLIGARLAGVLPERSLRAAVAVILVFVGLVLFSRGSSAARPHSNIAIVPRTNGVSMTPVPVKVSVLATDLHP